MYQLKWLCVPDCAYTENMFINSTHISLYDISLRQNILYQIKRDMAAWKRLGSPQRNQRTWRQIVATPYTGLAKFSYSFLFLPVCWENAFSFFRQKWINTTVLTEQTIENFDWKLIGFIMRGRIHWNFSHSISMVCIKKNAPEDAICKMAGILYQPQCVKRVAFEWIIYCFP